MSSYEFLKQLDISEDASATFDSLLSHPKGISAVGLSKKMNKPRATLYDHLNILVKKGLVKKGKSDDGAVFYPEDPRSIKGVFEERSYKVDRSGELFEKYLDKLPGEEVYNPKLTVIDNKNAAEIVFRDALRSNEKESYWFWPAKSLFHKTVPDEVFDYWHNERIRRKMHVKVLWPYKQKVKLAGILGSDKDSESLRQIRIMPGPVDASMGYGIYGNKVGFISSTKENFGFIVDSKELADTLRSQFKFFWDISKGNK